MKYLFSMLLLVFLNSVYAQLEEETAIRAVMERYKDDPGLSIGVFKGGEIIHHHFTGYANLEHAVKTKRYTVYDLASAAKQFTAASIVLLENQGRLSLHDPISKYIPEFPDYPEGKIIIDHLIHHTSGIRDYNKIQYVKGIPWNNSIDNRDILPLITSQRGINFVPGEKYAYSNSNYVLLAEIVQRISGKSFAQFTKEEIFTPLGMTQSFYHDDRGAMVSNRASAYNFEENNWHLENYLNAEVVGDGGLYTTMDDLFKWNENLRKGKIGNEFFLEKLLENGTLNNGEKIQYSGGLFVGPESTGRPTIGHSGNWGGFNSLFYRFPDEDLTFVILSNNGTVNVWAILNELRPLFLDPMTNPRENSNQDVNIQTIQLNQNELSAMEGHYFNPIDGYTREISIKNGELYYQRSENDPGTPLEAISKAKFIFKGAPHVVLDLTQDRDRIKKVYITIGSAQPIELINYTPEDYTIVDLKKYEGIFYSEEIDETYEIVAFENNLKVMLHNKPLVTVFPVMKGVFNDIHFGYLKFYENRDAEITRFTINDELARGIEFLKMDNV